MSLHSPADRAREDRVARILEPLYGVAMHRMPEFYPVDWYAERGDDVPFWAELKTGNYDIGAYPTVMLSVAKYHALYSHGIETGRRGLFAFGWADGSVRAIDVRLVNAYAPRVDGRKDRGREHDLEPMIRVRVDDMDVVCGPGTP